MTTPPPAQPLRLSPAPVYQAPAIIHKTQLKHFSGSPLATDPNTPDHLLGLPQ